MKKGICIFILLITLSMSVPSHAQTNYSHSLVQGNTITFYDPTYNGIPINTNAKTSKQWAAELGYGDGYKVSILTECFNPSETVPNCLSWGPDETAGYNYGTWEVHDCAYDNWAWDGCNLRVVAVRVEVVQIVQIDIQPDSDLNLINCRHENGVVTVALLTTDTLDVATVDHSTVAFENASVTHVHPTTGKVRRIEQDVDGDGDIDLIFQFRFGDTDLTCASPEATLLGQTFDGLKIMGTAAVRMVPYGIDGCHEESHPAWKWEGQWMLYYTDAASGGVLASYPARNSEQDVYAEFEFLAEGFGLVYHKGPYGGIANVYLDNMDTPYTQLDMYAVEDRWLGDAVLVVDGLDPTVEHLLRIVPAEEKNIQSLGYAIGLDRIDLPAFRDCSQ
jgi:hypothetical protein